MGGSAVFDDDCEITSLSNGVKTLVLVGRTGNGKSATCNSILGKKFFKSKTSSSGVTTTCELQSTMLKDGQILNVIDTPGLFDVSVGPEIIGKEIAKCIHLARDGIHAVVVVLSVRTRFSDEEKDALQRLQTMFGSKIVNYMIVVFTGGDAFDEEDTFEDYLGLECPKPLHDILLLCQNRFVLFDNKTKDESKREKQVEDLVLLVNKVIAQNGGEPYSDELFVELKRGEISELKVQMERSNQEQLRKISETVESKLIEATTRLEKQLEEARAAQKKAEKEAELSKKKSNDEMRNLRANLDRMNREAHDLRRQLDNKCVIQ